MQLSCVNSSESHRATRRRRTRLISQVAIVALFLFTALPGKAATRFYVIPHAPKPPQCGADEPNQAPGAWIQNKSCGYWIGTAMGGGTFDSHESTSTWYRFGRHGGGSPNMCGWIPPNSVQSPSGTVPDSCSEETKNRLRHRVRIGRDFNAPAHQAVDGTEVPANPACTMYYNYFSGSDLLNDGGRWANPAGVPQGTVRYRYTTRDCGAVVVRDYVLGWGFLPRACVQRPTILHNDDDVADFPLQPDPGTCPPIPPPPPDPCSGVNCDDGNPCTDDACIVGQCVHTDNSVPCDDSDPCTTNDICVTGSCRGTFGSVCLAPILSILLDGDCGDGVLDSGEQCDDGNNVSGDCCSSTCEFESAGSPCSDWNTCTVNDQCDGDGSCLSGQCELGKPCGMLCGETLTCQETAPDACECSP